MIVPRKPQAGFTLVELIMSIVIISISLTGILSVMTLTISHSADPMVQHQAIAIAESYLEEILLLPYSDPDSTEVGETRATYDDVDDYNGLSDTGVHDQSDSIVAGLTGYNIAVAVAITTVSGVTVKRVDVTVSGSGADDITLTGYRSS